MSKSKSWKWMLGSGLLALVLALFGPSLLSHADETDDSGDTGDDVSLEDITLEECLAELEAAGLEV
ncbi:MAG: hypothetical protein AMXMBFR84_13220 [Candidatus Hydrogenedentota bacterium]